MCLPVARVPPYNPLVDARDSTTPPFWSTGARTMATQSNLSPDTAADFSARSMMLPTVMLLKHMLRTYVPDLSLRYNPCC